MSRRYFVLDVRAPVFVFFLLCFFILKVTHTHSRAAQMSVLGGSRSFFQSVIFLSMYLSKFLFYFPPLLLANKTKQKTKTKTNVYKKNAFSPSTANNVFQSKKKKKQNFPQPTANTTPPIQGAAPPPPPHTHFFSEAFPTTFFGCSFSSSLLALFFFNAVQFFFFFFLVSKRFPLHCPGSQWERIAVIKKNITHRIFITHFYSQKTNLTFPPLLWIFLLKCILMYMLCSLIITAVCFKEN